MARHSLGRREYKRCAPARSPLLRVSRLRQQKTPRHAAISPRFVARGAWLLTSAAVFRVA